MNLATHLLASWIIGAQGTNNSRDCRLVALAGVMPDADGLGIVVDVASRALGWKQTFLFQDYHHYLLHGAFGAVLTMALLACFAQQKTKIVLLSLVAFHLHLLCDLVGSRGAAPDDLWPIFYFGPFSKSSVWLWKGQWALDAWPNRLVFLGVFGWALWLGVSVGHSFLGVFSRRLDEAFVGALAKVRAVRLSKRHCS